MGKSPGPMGNRGSEGPIGEELTGLDNYAVTTPCEGPQDGWWGLG